MSIQEQETQNSKSNPAGKVREAASKAAGHLADKTGQAASDTIHAAREEADKVARKGQSEMQHIVRSLGRAIDAGGVSLERDGMPGTAGYVRAAARGVEQAADEVDGLNPQSVTTRVEQFVRDRPLATAGILAVAGFAFASFVNARSDK